MVKIGMTRRPHPLRHRVDPARPHHRRGAARLRRLGLENALHRELSAQRVNKINTRREFFHADPAQVHELLKKHAGAVLEYVVDLEFRQGTVDTEHPASAVV